MKKANSGLTFIELLTVVAIVSILTLTALSAMNEYSIRAKLSEIITLASATKIGLAEACIAEGAMPTSASKAGISLDSNQSQYVASIEYDYAADLKSAWIRYTLIDVDGQVNGKGFELLGTCGTGSVNWDCLGDPGLDRLLPKGC